MKLLRTYLCRLLKKPSENGCQTKTMHGFQNILALPKTNSPLNSMALHAF